MPGVHDAALLIVEEVTQQQLKVWKMLRSLSEIRFFPQSKKFKNRIEFNTKLLL